MLPLARSGDTNAYHATMAEISAYASTSVSSGAYGNIGRNLLHNPMFTVAQRGTGPFTLAGYTLDRWFTELAGDTVSVSQVALADADRTAIGDETAAYALQNVFTGGSATGNYNQVAQRIERVHRLSGKTVTLSFWAKVVAGTPPNLLVQYEQFFGTGGSPSAGVLTSAGLSGALSTTWTRYTLTTALPSAVGKVFGTNGDDSTEVDIVFSEQGSSLGVHSGTVQLWGVQLEIGSVATPLAKRDPEDDMALCQRFYQVGYFQLSGYQVAGDGFNGTASLAVDMRASPNVTFSGTTLVNLPSISNVAPTLPGFVAIGGIATATGATSIVTYYSASADL